MSARRQVMLQGVSDEACDSNLLAIIKRGRNPKRLNMNVLESKEEQITKRQCRRRLACRES